MFSDKSLSAFPEFQALPVGLQAMILKLVRESRLNDHGCFKRPSNVWLLFRSDMFASFDDKTINQGDFSSSCQDAWNKMTDDQRANLQARADAEKTKLLELFPDYEYRPMTPDDKKIWSSMSAATKRSFWLAAVARIAERMMNPNGRWDGFLKLSGWIRDNMESSALTTSKRNATRGYGSDSTQPKASSSHTRAPHPYRQARDLASTRTPTQDRSGKLPKEFAQLAKSFLVRLKNKKESQKRRRPVLALFQPVDMCLYVEEELDDDIPDHVHNSLTLEPSELSEKSVFLRGYANPFVPEALDQYGDWYIPEFKSVAEYNEYIEAYYDSEDLSTAFIWPPVEAVYIRYPPDVSTSSDTSPSPPAIATSPVSNYSLDTHLPALSPGHSEAPTHLDLGSYDKEFHSGSAHSTEHGDQTAGVPSQPRYYQAYPNNQWHSANSQEPLDPLNQSQLSAPMALQSLNFQSLNGGFNQEWDRSTM